MSENIRVWLPMAPLLIVIIYSGYTWYKIIRKDHQNRLDKKNKRRRRK
ncbi:MAG: hypothetical protein NC548_28395 [Lachnospiraceae bacterium]|nr:hypothetical protein [Lachnospiraceae bacterium]MCM1232012.1 hypothetical protein [Ruminococcus flavefaciens]